MKRKILDAIIFILFLLVMSFHFMPRILHEILGLIMAATVLVHFFINRRKFFYSIRGKMSARNIFSNLIIISTLIIFVMILISGICMSNYIFHDYIPFDIRRNFMIHRLHVSMPYVFMILIGCHVGLHWREIIKIKNSILSKIFMAVIICVGIYGSFLNRVGDRILMKHIFATPATDRSFIEFLCIIFCTTGIYSVITFLLDEKLRLCKNKAK